MRYRNRLASAFGPHDSRLRTWVAAWVAAEQSSSAPPSGKEGLQELGALFALQHLHAAAHAAHKAFLCIGCPCSLLLRHAGQGRHVPLHGIAQSLDLHTSGTVKPGMSPAGRWLMMSYPAGHMQMMTRTQASVLLSNSCLQSPACKAQSCLCLRKRRSRLLSPLRVHRHAV